MVSKVETTIFKPAINTDAFKNSAVFSPAENGPGPLTVSSLIP